MKVDLLIIDYVATDNRNYGNSICKYLKKMVPGAVTAKGYFKRTDDLDIEKIDGYDYIFCIQDYKLNPQKVLDNYTPKAVMTFSFRFCDYMFALEAHKYGIPVFNFQHALYQPDTVISKITPQALPLLIRSKREKIYLYSKCMYYICNKDFLFTAKMIRELVAEVPLYKIMQQFFGKSSVPDVCLIYGMYWKSYYEKQFLVSDSEFEIVGYPELENPVEKTDASLFEDHERPTLCYLAQSSVEDGVLSRDVMIEFSQKMETLLSQYNLIIKFHPRSDRTLYSNLISEIYQKKVAIWGKATFPAADGYIAHQSTVIAQAMNVTGRVLIVRIKENQDLLFEKYTDHVCDYNADLLQCVNQMMQSEFSSQCQFEELAYKNKQGALYKTAKIISNGLK